jgi:hypothetical protein
VDEEQIITIETRLNSTTPGDWHAVVTDDVHYQGAVYVGLDPRGEWNGSLFVDDGRGKKLLVPNSLDPQRIVAITCLQEPELVVPDECDQNAIFIANAKKDIAALIAEVKRLKHLLRQGGVTE